MTRPTRFALGDIRLSPKMLASFERNYELPVRLLRNLRSDKLSMRLLHSGLFCRRRLKTVYVQDRAARNQRVLRPLQEKAEPAYVLAGSKVESTAKHNARKRVESV